MKCIGIIGAMTIEVELLKNNIEISNEEIIAGFSVYSGRIGDKYIVLSCCGEGKVNAAACTQMMIDRFNVDCIINAGVAGGLYSGINTCDVVIGTNVAHHDVTMKQKQNFFPYKEYFECDEKLIEIAEKACEKNKFEGWKYYKGRIVSGEKFIDDKLVREKIIEEYSPHCVEMEGSAIGHVAYINNVPFIVIRSISDKADEVATLSYEAFEEKAAVQSGKIVLSMINMI